MLDIEVGHVDDWFTDNSIPDNLEGVPGIGVEMHRKVMEALFVGGHIQDAELIDEHLSKTSEEVYHQAMQKAGEYQQDKLNKRYKDHFRDSNGYVDQEVDGKKINVKLEFHDYKRAVELKLTAKEIEDSWVHAYNNIDTSNMSWLPQRDPVNGQGPNKHKLPERPQNKRRIGSVRNRAQERKEQEQASKAEGDKGPGKRHKPSGKRAADDESGRSAG